MRRKRREEKVWRKAIRFFGCRRNRKIIKNNVIFGSIHCL
jgi:hypothetical protein